MAGDSPGNSFCIPQLGSSARKVFVNRVHGSLSDGREVTKTVLGPR